MKKKIEQAVTPSLHKPRICKRFVDDTFAILVRESVECFPQHLNHQQPFIRFMETESGRFVPDSLDSYPVWFGSYPDTAVFFPILSYIYIKYITRERGNRCQVLRATSK